MEIRPFHDEKNKSQLLGFQGKLLTYQMSAFIFCFQEVGKIAVVLNSFPLICRALVSSKGLLRT